MHLQLQSMVESLEVERKELLDRVKKLERCEREERERFLRERAAKDAVLQVSSNQTKVQIAQI